MAVYILEFSRPIGSARPRGRARYYVGWCKDGEIDRRLREHRSGQGATITRYAARAGIGINLIAVLPGTRQDERRIKNLKNTPRLVEQLRRRGKLLEARQ